MSDDRFQLVSEQAARTQCNIYLQSLRIPIEVYVDEFRTPWVRMTATEDFGGLSMPARLAYRVLDKTPSALAVEYTLTQRVTLLVYFDRRADEYIRTAFDRLGVGIAGLGTHVMLPVEPGNYPFRWARNRHPEASARLPYLSEVEGTLRSIGAIRRRSA
ncbi:hypothetical protein [Nocardia pseudobrasiliensis]|nr:hypothetical protein [Nocardia pseudobrasiliensis]